VYEAFYLPFFITSEAGYGSGAGFLSYGFLVLSVSA